MLNYMSGIVNLMVTKPLHPIPSVQICYSWMMEYTHRLTPEALALLQTVESTFEEVQREQAIAALEVSQGADVARALIETYERCMWRSTKKRLIRAIGNVKSDRATTFLTALARDSRDLPLAGEAVLALGATDDPLAGEFLLSVVGEGRHPLSREAVLALTNLAFFPCDDEIEALLSKADTTLAPSLVQCAIMSLGIRGRRSAEPLVQRHLAEGVASGIFNSALLAAGRVGGAGMLTKLAALDTRYRFFAHQLKLSAIERITLRLKYTVEDAMASLTSAHTDEALKRAMRLLVEFPVDQAAEAFEVLGQEAAPGVKAIVRMVLFDPKKLDDDLKFLAANRAQIPWHTAAGLIRRHYHALPKNHRGHVFEALRFKLSQPDFVELFSKVRADEALEILPPIIDHAEAPITIKIQAVNGLVAQCVMAGYGAAAVESIGARMLELHRRAGSVEVAARLLRALGQIGYGGQQVITELRSAIKRPDVVGASAYAAASLLGGEEAFLLVGRRLRSVLRSPDMAEETVRAVEALASMGRIDVPAELEELSPPMRLRLKLSLLQILTRNSVPAFASFIEEALSSEDFQTQMLAIAATRYNMSPVAAAALFGLVGSDNGCIAGRALDSLCFAGRAADHRHLLDIVKARVGDVPFVTKVCRGLVPEEGGNYADFVKVWSELVALGQGAFAEREIVVAANNLKDNIELAASRKPGDAEKAAAVLAGKAAQHSVDDALNRQLKGYAGYSETVKSVLRNAELIQAHPDLFDDRVDKSTAVVQYVKSIDILLQERIGSRLFIAASASDALAAMQSRIVALQLDEENVTADQFLTALQCGNFFTAEDLPAVKLETLNRAIMSGKIIRDQYRLIDGLRAWAMLLLAFGRTYKLRGVTHESIFKLRATSGQAVGELARKLNDLQELRNLAAHRGTLREGAPVMELRHRCFEALNDIEALV